MQKRMVWLVSLSSLFVVFAGACESEGIVTEKPDAGADGGPSHDGPADLSSDAKKPKGWAIPVGGGPIWEVVVVDSGHVIVLGRLNDKVELEGVKGMISITATTPGSFIAKLDLKVRKWLWAVPLDGIPCCTSGGGYDGLGVDAAGNIYHAGKFEGTVSLGPTELTSAGSYDIVVNKLDPNGTFLWSVSAGGKGEDDADALAVGSDGKITICGLFSSTATFGAKSLTAKGKNDILVARLKPTDGEFDWAVRAGSASTSIEYEYAGAVEVDSSGNSYITGSVAQDADFDEYATKSWPGERAYVAKIDPAGNFTLLGDFPAQHGNSIALDASGGVYVVGGLHLGSSDAPEPYQGNAVMVAGGKITSKPEFPTLEFFTVTWHEYGLAKHLVYGSRLVVDGQGDVVVAGMFRGGVLQFIGSLPLTSPVLDSTLYLARFSSAGTLKKQISVPATVKSSAVGLALDKKGGLYIGGVFRGTADFDGTILKSSSASRNDGFVWYIPPGPE